MPAPRKQEQWWRDDENIVILNRGEVQLAVPRVWLVEGKGEGTASYLQLKDPGDNCSFNISPISIPPLVPETPPIEEMLREVLRNEHPGATLAEIHKMSRGTVESAWMDYSYEEEDTERGEWRVAHARVMFAWNRALGALVSFYYWEDDADWAVPAWQRMVETIRLGARGAFSKPDPRWRRN